jgi:hypothetical protein
MARVEPRRHRRGAVSFSPDSPSVLGFSSRDDAPDVRSQLGRLGSLSDGELIELVDRLIRVEQDTSYQRGILHGKIDIV